METLYVRTKDEFWLRTTKFWMRLFGINFAIGVATGLILEFEFGTNWSNYSHFVGDIFGAPLAIEGIFAFFLESTFIAVMFFGWRKVSSGFHLAATWLTAIGANLSAWWILVANAWMQHPVGCDFNLETVRNEMTSFSAVALSPVAVNKFFHTVTSSFVLAALFVVGVSAWYLLRRREQQMARKSIAVASAFGFVFALITAFTGDRSGAIVAHVQPMKLAAMEALYEGQEGAPLTAVGILRPNGPVNGETFRFQIGIPKMLSLMSFRDADAFVPGIYDLVYGNEERGIMSAAEKIERGRTAVDELGRYRAAREAGDTAAIQVIQSKFDRSTPEGEAFLRDHFAYFGYGYLDRPEQDRAQRAAAVLFVPRDGRRGLLFHPAAGRRLVAQPQRPPRRQTLAAVGGRMDRPAGLPRLAGRMDRGRGRTPAVGHSGPDARGRRGLEDPQRIGLRDLLPLPGALHRAARRRTEHHVPADQNRT